MSTVQTYAYLGEMAAFLSGVCVVVLWAARKVRHTYVQQLRVSLGMVEQGSDAAAPGTTAWLVQMMKARSSKATVHTNNVHERPRTSSQRMMQRIVHAGLQDSVTLNGVRATQRMLCLAGGAAGALLGSFFTTTLAMVAGVAGVLLGFFMPQRALASLAVQRKKELESTLSQTLEVICLGLRAGLSFDRALALYCESFEGTFASEMQQSMNLWQAGIVSREQALRALSETYDSPLLARVVDNIVRSLRFGSPLADSLEVLAVEARQAHRAQVQEAVMKAPVKMMVPVGALILPSMLMLVLGPVLLDLMNGF